MWSYLERGGTRAVAVWHRRAGKDSLAANWAAVAAHRRVGVYWHMLPQQNQARKVVWDGIDHAGRRLIDQAFPPQVRAATNVADMKITLKCGSLWQCVGSDSYDSLVGANPVGVVFSEYALADPAAWDFIRPILAENGGWALFLYTPRGRNHGARLYDLARRTEGWFGERLTVADTGAIAAAAVEAERDSGMDEALIQQEYFCSFDSAAPGAYYGGLLAEAERAGRIGRVPREPAAPVITAWDLGIGDATAIWFLQAVGREIRAIDYYEASGAGLDHYARVVRDKPYVYAEHLVPHDADHLELGTGTSRVETLRRLGLRTRVIPRIPNIADGINAVRLMLPRTWFDQTACARGLDALRQYQREWDDRLQDFKMRPRHDWTSHAADAFRTFAQGFRPAAGPLPPGAATAGAYDPLRW